LHADVGLVFALATTEESYVKQSGNLLLIDLGMASRTRQHDVVDGVPLLTGKWVATAWRLHGVDRSDDVCAFPKWDFAAAETALKEILLAEGAAASSTDP
jgi:hypothetical protein